MTDPQSPVSSLPQVHCPSCQNPLPPKVRQMALQCFHCDTWVGLVKGQLTEMKSHKLVSKGQVEQRKRYKKRARSRAAGVVSMPSRNGAFLCGMALAVTLLSHAGLVFPNLGWFNGNWAVHPYIGVTWGFWIFAHLASLGSLGALGLGSLAVWGIGVKFLGGYFPFWTWFLPGSVAAWSAFTMRPKAWVLAKKRLMAHPRAILFGMLAGLPLFIFFLPTGVRRALEF